jgi:membrane carboxypeptidase/penicillin-binding protein PbpC
MTSGGPIALRAKTDADVREIYWFAGNTFIARTKPQDVVTWKAAPGSYELTALDDHGRAGASSVIVR